MDNQVHNEVVKTKTKKTFIQRLDYFLNKLLPKKLIVWIVATILVFKKILPGDLWAYLSMVYIFGNVAEKYSGIENKMRDIINGEEKK